jgi:hypothetical protein
VVNAGTARALRPAFGLLVAGILVCAVAGGLWRAGAAPGWHRPGLAHGPLMLSAFFGGVIALERAVALKRAWAFTAPLAALSGGALLIAGQAFASAWALGAAAAVFVAVNVAIVARQREPHTVLLLVAALCWALAASVPLTGFGDALRWGFAFPVLTVAAERLEMTRLARRPSWAPDALAAIVGMLLLGAAASAAIYGVALMALALWLAVFDIARHTVRSPGLARYMALALLGGYAWLGFGGLAWLGWALGCPGRDLALHAVGLGFLVAMVMGHAPVIVPALARVRLAFGPWFYAPLVLLHASLLWRFAGSRAEGALGNALALALFAATLAVSALACRRRRWTTPR